MRWTGLVALVVLGSGCALFRGTPPIPRPVVDGVQTGTASWYGPGFHGNRTANGEVYDQHDITAAHPSLPLGTRAVVTNLSNGRAVEVRINDRGPFVGGRVIDLSYGAARVIGMIGPGTAPVRIEVLGDAPLRVAVRAPSPAPRGAKPPPPSPRVDPVPPPAEPGRRFAVEVASFGDPGKADHLERRLRLRFPEAHVSPLEASAGTYYRVRIGPYPFRQVAAARAELVSRLGYPAIITEDGAE